MTSYRTREFLEARLIELEKSPYAQGIYNVCDAYNVRKHLDAIAGVKQELRELEERGE